jgi:hypothetical protein
MDPLDLSWKQLSEPDGDGETLLSRWAAGTLDEATERAVNLHLLSSTWARDEAALHLAMRDGLRVLAGERSPLQEGLRVAVRAVLGAIEVLERSLRPLAPAGVLTRSGTHRPATSRTFPVDALAPGALLHVQLRGARFAVELSHPPGEDREWALSGPAGDLVASGAHGVAFPPVGPGTWALRSTAGGSRALLLELLPDEEVAGPAPST